MNLDHSIVGVTESPETKALMAALVQAQKEFKPVKKSAENKFAGFRYPTYGDMAAATYPALNKHGLVMQFQEGCIGGREVLVGRLRHKDGEWIASMVPIHYPTKKGGEVQEDGQGLEVGNAYARKTLLMQLTGAWLEGDEPEVSQDQVKKEVESVVAEAGAQPSPSSADYFNKINARMKAVRSIPAELEKCFEQAESLAESGDLTADQLARLTRQFGALRKKEASHA